ncbi:MAG: aminotransferase class I/II-fold pyridoxal phosphate-dependent enzyme [Pseudomonadota bacterium]
MQKLDFNERSDQFPLWAANTLSQLATHDLWRYPDRSSLENKIADHFSLSADQVLVTNGADEAIQLLISLIKANETIILPTPTFSMYEIGINEWQCQCKVVEPNPDFTLNIDLMHQAISEQQGGWFILVRPNNPTGECIPVNELESLIAACEQKNITCVIDEAYAEFANDDGIKFLNKFDNLLILRTFSKAYGLAGLRVGYVLASNADLLNALQKRCLPFNVNSISLHVAEAALSSEALEEVETYCTAVKANRDKILNLLRQAGFKPVETGGNFVFFETTSIKKAFLLALCKQRNIAIKIFELPNLVNCVRITITKDTTWLESTLCLAFLPNLICLDMDGVLIDTEESYDAAVLQTIKQLTNQTLAHQALFDKRCQGGYNNDWVLTKALLDDMGYEISLEQVTDTFQEIYLGRDEAPGLIANEKPLLQNTLKERFNSSPVAIVTGRPRYEAELGRRFLGLQEIPIASLDDVKNGKPDPEGILQMKQKFSAHTIWMLGDNVDDIQAAHTAGAIGIGIGIGSKKAALLDAGATLVFDSINELNELLPTHF